MQLEPAIPVRPLATMRGQFGGAHLGERRETAPLSLREQVERLPRLRPGRREVDHAGQAPVVGKPLPRHRTHGERDLLRPQDAEQSRHRVGRETGGREAERVGVEQRVQRVRPLPELVRHIVKRLVDGDRTGSLAAQRQVRVLVADRARRRARDLQRARPRPRACPH